ncbi:MAG: hypothetical protein ABSH24_16305 [Bryobacteraceae bacterium]|jgi:uncharacterized protein (TIGR03437 family)
MKRLAWSSLLLFIVATWPAAAQSWDTSGNGLLNGTYYFRQVMWLGGYNSANDLQEAIAIYGNIVFGGNGTYTLTAKTDDAAANTVTSITGSGTYTIAASGYGYMSTPLRIVYSQFEGDEIHLLVSPSKVVVGSATDNNSGYNDLFLAAPEPTSTPSLQGTFSVIGVGIPALTLDLIHTRAYSFTMTGTSSTVTTTALSGAFGLNTTAMTQPAFSGVNYSVTAGAAAVTFSNEPTAANLDSNLMSGTKYFYFSPDGNFFFGGDPEDTDFILGVRQGSSGSFAAQIPYYTGGLFQDDSQVGSCDCVWLNSTYGGYDVLTDANNGEILAHQRDNVVGPPRGSFLEDYTYSIPLSVSGGKYADYYNEYFFGPGGTFAIGFANESAGFLGIEVLMEGPNYTSPTTSVPYIYPTGIVNAGSFVPFTAEFVPGEFIAIFGANLATTTAADPTLPTGLGGVQVLVNGTPTAVRYVSPGQVNAVIPLDIDTGIASIQVVNSLGTSNAVSNYVGVTQPGIFNSTTSAPAVFHGDNTIVSASSPAVVGEELAVYLTGLGTLDSLGNATSLSYLSVDFSGVTGTIDYAGIEPGTPLPVGAGYQMNVTVPSGTTSGLNYLDIGGLDSYNSEAVICVTICADSSLRSSVRNRRAKTTRSAARPRFPHSPRVVFPRRPEAHQPYNGDQPFN